jgi:hypothetical protein
MKQNFMKFGDVPLDGLTEPLTLAKGTARSREREREREREKFT